MLYKLIGQLFSIAMITEHGCLVFF